MSETNVQTITYKEKNCLGEPYNFIDMITTTTCTVSNVGGRVTVQSTTIPSVGPSSTTVSPSSDATVKPGAPASMPSANPPSPIQSPSMLLNSPGSASSSKKDCFSGSETVTLESGGYKALSEVVPGDRILTSDGNGDLSYSEVSRVRYCPVTRQPEE
jgi:Hint module